MEKRVTWLIRNEEGIECFNHAKEQSFPKLGNGLIF
jgi:hypothetical protein